MNNYHADLDLAEYLLMLKNLRRTYDQFQLYYKKGDVMVDTSSKTISAESYYLNVTTAQMREISTKIENLQTTGGENVFTYTSPFTAASTGFLGINIPKAPESGVSSVYGREVERLNQYNLARALTDSFELGQGETASATPEPARVISPSELPTYFVRGSDPNLMRLDELESEVASRRARGVFVPQALLDEISRLRGGQFYEEGSLSSGLFKDLGDSEDPGGSGDPGDLGDSGDPQVITDDTTDTTVTDTTVTDKTGVGGFNFEVKPPEGFVPPISTVSLGSDPSLQGLLDFFLSNPDDYINEIPIYQDVYNKDGVVVDSEQIGTEQVLSPLAEAALRAYSTQLGTASQDLASRFGTATPFGAIAGLDGTVDQAIALAELQARAGITNPYAALGTGSEIANISTILRGGLTVDEQLALEGLRARGGLSAEQRLAELGAQYNPFSETAADRLALARAQASGGLTEESNILAAQQAAAANNPFAAAQLGIDIGNISTILRGGLTPEQQLALAQAPGNPFGLTAQQQIDLQNQLARGGLTAQQQFDLQSQIARGGLTAQEQRDLVGLQARGGLTVQEQLNLAGLQARGGLTAQERLAEQRLAALSPLLQASPGTLGGLSRVLGGEAQLQGLFSPFTSDTSATGMGNVMQQTSPTPFTTQSMERPRQTIGDYQRADLFDRGAIEAEAGMAGEELDRYLGQVSLGAGSPRGSLGAQLA